MHINMNNQLGNMFIYIIILMKFPKKSFVLFILVFCKHHQCKMYLLFLTYQIRIN